MSLLEHLGELRVRLIVSILALGGSTLVAFFFAWPVLGFLISPISEMSPKVSAETPPVRLLVAPDGRVRVPDPGQIAPRQGLLRRPIELVWTDTAFNAPPDATVIPVNNIGTRLRYQGPMDPFMEPLTVAFIMGVLLALPIIIWQIWLFVKPGLTGRERQVVKPLLGGFLIMFPVGAAFAFYMTKLIVMVMQTYQISGIDANYDVSKYLSLLTTMMLVFGVIFEMPLILAVATRIGLFSPRLLTTYRRHAYVFMAIGAALLTPADPFSMIAAYVPMIALYELSVILCRPIGFLREREQKKAGGGS